MKKDWEERFDYLFWEHRVPRNTKQAADIKSFIRETLEAQMSDLRKEVESMMGVNSEWTMGGNGEKCIYVRRDEVLLLMKK